MQIGGNDPIKLQTLSIDGHINGVVKMLSCSVPNNIVLPGSAAAAMVVMMETIHTEQISE